MNPCSYAELIAARVLVEPECYAPGSRIEGAGGKKPTRAAMVGDAVFWWKKYANGMRTFCFASNVAHSMALRDEFRKAGVPAAHVDGTTPDEERDELLGTPGKPGALARGEVLVLVNCNVTRYGVDVPEAECCQIVAPMTSLVDFRQSCGRVMRSHPGKSRAVVIDHAGAVLYHGFPHADLPWTLDGSEDHVKRQRDRMESGEAPRPVACPQCHTLYSGRVDCPACGWRPAARAKGKETTGGTLTRVTDAGVPRMTPDELAAAWRQKVGIAANKGMTLGAAAKMFEQETGRLPWRCAGLPHVPGDRGDWKRPAGDVFPQFKRGRAAAAVDPEGY